MNHTILHIDKHDYYYNEKTGGVYFKGFFEIPEECCGKFIKIYSIRYKLKHKHTKIHIKNYG